MKLMLLVLLLTTSTSLVSQSTSYDSTSASPDDYSLEVVGTVSDSEGDYAIIVVEELIRFGARIHVLPESGEQITIRLPGRDQFTDGSRLLLTVKESIQSTETPSAYILVKYELIGY